jgi:pyruvate dehydrogenase phosphatase
VQLARKGYDLGFANLARVGSCCLCSVVINNKVYVANIGDSRGVMIQKDGGLANGFGFTKLNAMQNCNSKKVQKELREKFPDEPDIIVNRSGQPGANYVKNRLMPTRSFGDLLLKYPEFNNPKNLHTDLGYYTPLKNFTGPYITHSPEIRVFELGPNDVGFLLASDGLWDEMNFKQVNNIFFLKVYRLLELGVMILKVWNTVQRLWGAP